MFRTLSLLICLTLATTAWSQDLTVSGTITAEIDGLPLSGASIVEKGTYNGAISDFDGNYILENVQTQAVLVVTYLGYKSKEVSVPSSGRLDVQLEEDLATLDQVVVTGYGTQKKKEITGAVGIVTAETIEDLKPTRIEQALQGQISGVQISSVSGSPGAPLDIRIRGISTNGDNQPLILLDGNVIEDLSVVNASDIESINVLKDATAGIYGVRAANGVILITTKTGRRATPLSFEYEAFGGFQETTRSLPALNATQYGLLVNEAFAADGQPIVFDNVAALGKGTDWQEEVFSKAPIFNQSFTVSGGTKRSTYNGGASLLTQDGIVGGSKSNFTRYTTRFNFSTEVIERLNLKANLLYSGSTRKTLPENGIGSVLYNGLNNAPNFPVREEDGRFSRAINLPIEVINPLAQIENEFNRTQVDKISGVFGINYSFWDKFKAEVNYQWNYSEVRGRFYFPVSDFGVEGVADKVFDRDVNVLVENTNFFRDYTFDAFLTYTDSFADAHNLEVTLGTSVFKTTGDAYSFTGTNLPEVPFSQQNIDDAEMVQNNYINRSSRIFDSRLLSYFGRLQYNYKEKYLLSVIVRRDGSSAFGPENKFGIFPSVSAGWIVSDENFLSESNTLDFLKLRGSYGIIGNDRIPAFGFASLLNGEGVYVLNDELVFGVATGAIANPDIKWEEQKTFDVGIDTRWINSKLSFEADYFRRETQDLLLVVQTSGTTGSTAPGSGNPLANAGSVLNQGFEFAVGYRDSFSDNFKFNVNFNFTTLDNEVLSVNNGIGFEPGGSFGIGQDFPARMEAGQPLGYFYGYQTDGIFQTQAEADAHPSQIALGANASAGDIRFVDTNGDGVIDPDDRTYIGDPIADITMGLNIGMEFNQFDFKAYFFSSLGNEIVRNYERNDRFTNRTTSYLQRWTGPGTSNSFPRVTTGATSNLVFSDFYVEDGSFLRAQNLQLGYTLSDSCLADVGLDYLRFYVAVNNAFTLTKYQGYDPTVSAGAPIGVGFDQGLYPTPRTYLLGLNMKL